LHFASWTTKAGGDAPESPENLCLPLRVQAPQKKRNRGRNWSGFPAVPAAVSGGREEKTAAYGLRAVQFRFSGNFCPGFAACRTAASAGGRQKLAARRQIYPADLQQMKTCAGEKIRSQSDAETQMFR